jgi:spore coat protein U-like protein
MKWSNTVLSAAALGLLALGLASTPAFAGSPASQTFTVQVLVSPNCSLTTSSLTFPTYSGLAITGSSAGIAVNCTIGTPYNIGLDGGSSGTGTEGGTLYMVSGPNKVSYKLFQDSSDTKPWGTEIGTNTVASTGTGASQTALPVYGTIAAGQAVIAGTYNDTVTANVYF